MYYRAFTSSAAEQLIKLPAVSFGGTACAAVSLRYHDNFFFGRRWGSEVVEAVCCDNGPNALDDEALHSHDAFEAVATHPYFVVDVH